MADRNGYIGRSPGDSSIVISRQEYTPSGVTTDFTFTSGYTVGYVDAYLNGARLIEASDYTATDGSTVSLTTAAGDGDVIELVAYKAFNVGNVTDATGNFSVGNNLTVTGTAAVTGNATFSGTISGDGSSLTGITTGVSINAAGGALQRVMLGNVTAGVANTLANTGSLYWNDNTSTLYATNVNVSGTMTTEDTQNVDSVGRVTAGLGVRATKGGAVITAGIVTAPGLDISTDGVDIDGQTDLDELQVAGVSTFSAKAVFNTAYPSIDADNEIQVGTAIQLGKAGVITATSFSGSGANLTGVSAGLSLKQAGSWISAGTAATTVNFASGATISNVDTGGGYPGIATITISAAGVDTSASSPSANTVVVIDLDSAQHHQLTLTAGITTVTCSGGTFGASHSVVCIQPSTGITTVGFSTYFLWPSGSSPNMSQGSSKVDMLSFVVHQEGAVGTGTELLASAGLDYT